MCHGWRVKGGRSLHEGADELLGMVPRRACGLHDGGDKVDVRAQFKLDLLGSLGHAKEARHWLQQ